MLAGRLSFTDDDAIIAMARHIVDAEAALDVCPDALSARIERVMRALRKIPTRGLERRQMMAEFRVSLAARAHGGGVRPFAREHERAPSQSIPPMPVPCRRP
jgi:hypothetical protein